MDLARDGACHLPGVARALLADLDRLADSLASQRAGHRIEGNAVVRALTAKTSLLQTLAAARIGDEAGAVRAILFNKSADANWGLGWHQDRTIAVEARHDVDGFGPWTVKAGITHVAPPFDLLAQILTMRIHIDPVPADNAPLLIAPGSHRLGLVSEGEMGAAVARCGIATCLAERGDVWLYATPMLHASERSTSGNQRRVLQIDFCAQALPPPLQWCGV
jgi:ectoine hydroxylase-related dioxygenase (phytanoyl-CoA dioxygenase family)